MPLYAGVCETNITPPPDVWMGCDEGRARAAGVHDELYARALVLDNGHKRVALVAADLIALPEESATHIRQLIASILETEPGAIMLHCTHTHGGPLTWPHHNMGLSASATELQENCDSSAENAYKNAAYEEAYRTVLCGKLIGVARQAADNLQPASLIYGEASAQIGVNRRQTNAGGRIIRGHNYGGPVSSLVQALCVNGADGRTFALLCGHACHPTTMEGANRLLTADWPGAAVSHLKERFRKESAETGMTSDALPIFLQGCCADIDPVRRGTWEAVLTNGRIIADAAHTARWNAHGHLGETLDFAEITVMLPLLTSPMQTAPKDPPEKTLQPFTIRKLTLGGATLLGFPAEMFVQYQQDFRALSSAPLFCLNYTNGYWGCLPIQTEFEQASNVMDETVKNCGPHVFAPESEILIRQAVQQLLDKE